MDSIYEKQARFVQAKTALRPNTAVVLGSGLGALAEQAAEKDVIAFEQIPDFPHATAPTHKGCFVFTKEEGQPVVYVQGRLHLYEGHTPAQAVNTIRLLHALGVKNVLLTNAAGGINKSFACGDLMLIEDHISLFVPSPLIGPNDDTIGPRFADMSACYGKALQKAVRQTAAANGIRLQKGVYVQLTGPQFETPAEIALLRRLGADAVGMSTVIEAIAARHAGMRVCGVSCITNLASGMLSQPLSGEEVTETANRVAPVFQKLIRKAAVKISGETENEKY